MKAMLLAAGLGTRMGSLVSDTPKPLLRAGKKALIEYHLDALARANVTDVIINVAYLADQIMSTLGDGKRYGVNIHYSIEKETGGLETGGGIYQALPLLGKDPFMVINGDIWTDYPFQSLRLFSTEHVHIVLVDNPQEHLDGDFALKDDRVLLEGDQTFTFAGISVYHPMFFANCKPGKFSVTPMLKQAMQSGEITGEHYQGQWMDIGEPHRLQALRNKLEVSA